MRHSLGLEVYYSLSSDVSPGGLPELPYDRIDKFVLYVVEIWDLVNVRRRSRTPSWSLTTQTAEWSRGDASISLLR